MENKKKNHIPTNKNNHGCGYVNKIADNSIPKHSSSQCRPEEVENQKHCPVPIIESTARNETDSLFSGVKFDIAHEIDGIDEAINVIGQEDICTELSRKIRHLKMIKDQIEAYENHDHSYSEKLAELQMHHDTTVGLWAIDRNPAEVTDLWIRKCLYRIQPTTGLLSRTDDSKKHCHKESDSSEE